MSTEIKVKKIKEIKVIKETKETKVEVDSDQVNSVSSEEIREPILFQVSQWSSFHELDSGEEEKENKKDKEENQEANKEYYKIQMFGSLKDGTKIYVKVNNFNPYFYVELPESWGPSQISCLMTTLRQNIYPNDLSSHILKHTVERKYKFYEFCNKKLFKFLKLNFSSHIAFKKVSYMLSKPVKINYSSKPTQLVIYESNLEPFLRFIHLRNLNPIGWVNISKYEYLNLNINLKKNKNKNNTQVNISVNWTDINYVESLDTAKFTVAAFDIECTSIDGAFPQAARDGDKIIQIATTRNFYGESKCYDKCVFTLNTCDDIENVRVKSFLTESELILAWAKDISNVATDFLVGYNTFGFDYKYIQDRSIKLNINDKLLKFLSKLPNMPATFVEQDLNSKGLGDNKFYYYNMPGIVQIDLLPSIRREHSLTSYTLDSVLANFVKESVKDIIIDKINQVTTIKTASTFGLEVDQFIKIYLNDGLSDNSYNNNEKFKILTVTSDSIIVNKIIEIQDVKSINVFWTLSKDDITPQEIFKFQEMSSQKRAIIAKYCVRDCVSCNELINKLQTISNNAGLAKVCSVPISFIFLRGQSIKSFSLVAKKCNELNYVIKVVKKKVTQADLDKRELERAKKLGVDLIDKFFEKDKPRQVLEDEVDESYEGATVLTPIVGIYKVPIPVLDYASLYPSSMIMRNLSHECLIKDPKYLTDPEVLENYYIRDITYYNADESTTTCSFVKAKNGELGIVPMILAELLLQRKNTRALIKTEKDKFKAQVLDGLQLAYKVTANSLYGTTGAPVSPIYMKEIAASTTATGREQLNVAKLFVEHIFPLIINFILQNKYDLYVKHMNLLFDKKIDELLGKELITKLKVIKDRVSDYYYLRIFQEKLGDITLEKRNEFIVKFNDQIKECLTNYTINPECIYGDTDSIFVNFKIAKNKIILESKEALKIGISLGVLSGDLINFVLPGPQNLTYEKTLYPFCILSKKRYVGNLYELSPDKFKQKSMGIALRRRDFAPIAKIVLGGIIRSILNENDLKKVIEFTKSTLKKIVYNEYSIDKYIISKTLRGEYADRTRIAHAVLADRITKRDVGLKPQVNSRVPYVFINVARNVTLQGDHIEDPKYVLEHNLQLDYAYYIEHQIINPCVQILQHIIKNPERLFETHIAICENIKKGKKPIGHFFKDYVEDKKGIMIEDKVDKVDKEEKVNKVIKKKVFLDLKVSNPVVKNGGFVIDVEDEEVKKNKEKEKDKKIKVIKKKVVCESLSKPVIKNGGFILED